MSGNGVDVGVAESARDRARGGRGLGAWRGSWWQVAVLLALWLTLFVVGLGDRGLAYSEGHRVGPAWEMLRAGMPWQAGDEWLVPRLFEQAYVRKPPGMSWAIALSTGLFGHTEMAARVPSAVAMLGLMVMSWWCASAWFGRAWGLVAGVTQALTPFFWSSARSAEIEMVHAGAVGLASLAMVHVMTRAGGGRWGGVGAGVVAGLAGTVMVLTKGPAGVPVIAAVLAAGCLAAMSVKVVLRAGMAAAAIVSALLLGAYGLAAWGALGRVEGPVIWQGSGEFLWDVREIDRIVTLPVVALASMMPGSLALVMVRWRGAVEDDRDQVARVLGLSMLLAVGLYTVIGVSNPRYTLPAAGLGPPLVAWAMARFWGRVGSPARVWRVLCLGHPAVWAGVLGLGFIGFLRWYEGPRGRTSGDAAGAGLGAVLEPAASAGATVWVDDLVECRPEVLLYARKFTPLLEIRWRKPLDAAEVAAGDVVIVRTDRHDVPAGVEAERERCAALIAGGELLHRFEVHKFAFEVYRVGGGG